MISLFYIKGFLFFLAQKTNFYFQSHAIIKQEELSFVPISNPISAICFF